MLIEVLFAVCKVEKEREANPLEKLNRMTEQLLSDRDIRIEKFWEKCRLKKY